MIKEDELIERKVISNEEVRDLMDQFDVPPIDLAEECECTYSTFQIYLGDNSTDMPKKHQQTIIHFFLKKFGYEDPAQKYVEERPAEPETSSSGEKDSTECSSDGENSTDKEMPEEDRGEALSHLIPESITFKPKNGLAEALIEALDIVENSHADVRVRDGQRIISINVEEG